MLPSFVRELDCELLRRFPDYESCTDYTPKYSEEIFFHMGLDRKMVEKARRIQRLEEEVNTKEKMLEDRRQDFLIREKSSETKLENYWKRRKRVISIRGEDQRAKRNS